MLTPFDALILGAGAAGLFCGWQAARRGRRVCVLDHMGVAGEKIRISGGGRCNFTNRHCTPASFLSQNPHFARSALARFTPADFIALINAHAIAWHDKGAGQLFCDGKATQIVDMLTGGLAGAGGTLRLSSPIRGVSHDGHAFRVETDAGALTAPALVIATGGLSIPKIGATGLGYDLARQFGHAVITPRPALVPLTFSEPWKSRFTGLSGIALPCRADAGGPVFAEPLLFTHRGLSGPAILQASSYWQEGQPLHLDLGAEPDLAGALRAARTDHPRRSLSGALAGLYPARFAEAACDWFALPGATRLADLSNAALDTITGALSHFTLTPSGTEGWRTAEVTAGGVDTAGLSSKTLESRHVPGLYFIGEVVDVTGWLGGHNFQWAWASAHACALALAPA